MKRYETIRGWLMMPVLLCLLLAAPASALTDPNAQNTAPPQSNSANSGQSANSAGAQNNSPVCTNFSNRKDQIFGGTFNANNSSGNATPSAPGLLAEIDGYIKDVVGNASFKLFSAFTSNAGYRNAVFASMVLMVLIYGVGFTIGVVQASFGQVLIRLVKIGIIATLVSPAGWSFFSNYVVRFFSEGTDDIIRGMMEIGTGAPVPAGASPFFQLDNLTKFLITPDSIIAIMGSAFTGGPFGLTMSAMLILSFWTFIKLILQAVQTYAITYVARALILGVAPIFFVFMLFGQTMNYFKSWVNTLLNLSLQPILLFTFLSFFIVLIESASKDMLGFELCWSETKLVSGAENRMSFWTFVKPGTAEPITRGDLTWKGSLECFADANATKCPEFPINILDILTFLILVYLAERFIQVLAQMSSELSNAFVNVDAGGKFQEFIQRTTERGGQTASSVNAADARSPSGGGGTNRGNTAGGGGASGRTSGGGSAGGGDRSPQPPRAFRRLDNGHNG